MNTFAFLYSYINKSNLQGVAEQLKSMYFSGTKILCTNG